MTSQLSNIITNLWSAFFPKKIKVSERLLRDEPPYHYNCRCVIEPKFSIIEESCETHRQDALRYVSGKSYAEKTEVRKAKFDEACFDGYFPNPPTISTDTVFTVDDERVLREFIDNIYKEPQHHEITVSFFQGDVLAIHKEPSIKNNSCIICFNQECSCY